MESRLVSKCYYDDYDIKLPSGNYTRFCGISRRYSLSLPDLNQAADRVFFDFLEAVPVKRKLKNKDVASGDVAFEDVASEGVPSKDVASEDVPSKDVASEDLPSKDVASEDLPSKDVAYFVDLMLSYLSGLDYLDRINGDEVRLHDTFRSNKYVLVFGYKLVRDFEYFHDLFPKDLVSLCSELYCFRDDFEMVVAISDIKSEDAFEDVLYQFPHFSLAVPFHHPNINESICDYLDVHDYGSYNCVLLNADQNVLCRGSDAAQQYLQKLLPKHPLDDGTFFNRLIRSTWPIVPSEAKGHGIPEGKCPFINSIKVLPEYAQDLNIKVSELQQSCPVRIGHSFNFMSLLPGLSYLVRNNVGDSVAVKEETFIGKYIMLCCFHVPIFRDCADARWVQELLNICFDLYSTRNDFEMVVAIKMNYKADYEAVFDHFLSGFPPCLVIPYKESWHRDFICRYLGLVDSSFINCLILDADVNRSVLLHGCASSFVSPYGADVFPFTKEKRMEVHNNKDITSQLSLEGLLGCNSSYVLEAGNKEKITISELNKKVVALYLCVDGSFASTLHEFHQQCLEIKLPFEIVVVYMPFISRLNPQAHKDKIDRLFKKKGISMSWWLLPFNNNVSQRFHRIMGCDHDFRVMIVGPHNKYVDKHGGKILKLCEVERYPFTREEGFVQKELKQLHELTLESLLVIGSKNYVYKGSTTYPLAHLQGKNVLVYYMFLERAPGNYHYVSEWYPEIKADVDDLEVVIVRLEDGLAAAYDDLEVAEFMKPWFVCPYDPEHSAILLKKILIRDKTAPETLLKFGSDGKICSFRAQDHLHDRGSKAFRELGDLRQDVITELKRHYSFMSDMWLNL